MLKLTVRYARYAVAALVTVGFGGQPWQN